MQLCKPTKQTLQEGLTFHKQERYDLAEAKYLEVLAEDFDNYEALFLLGTIYMITGRVGIATQLFLRCVVIKEDYFEAWNNLGNCYKAANKEEEAVACWEAALKVEGREPFEYADIHNNLATVHVNSGNPHKGLPHIKKCLELKPDHADGLWNLSLMQLEMGEYAHGFRNYSAGFRTHNRLFRNYDFSPTKSVKEWKGEPLDGKCIAVWGEQGMGDEILFASIIPDLAKQAKKVIIDAHPRLAHLFKVSFPENVVVYPTRKENMIAWPFQHEHELEYKCAIGDLPRYFRRTIEDFPVHTGYLRAEPNDVQFYREKLAKLGPGLKVGISWTGGYKKTRQDYRSIMLDQWGPILKTTGVDFISLQYTKDAYKTAAEAEELFDVRIHHWPNSVEATDYHRTAALVSALDLVITVNTCVHHLAGALGKECWTLTPVAKAWRYYSPAEDQSVIPWYPSVKQFQQKKLFEWDEVINDVSKRLKYIVESHSRELLRPIAHFEPLGLGTPYGKSTPITNDVLDKIVEVAREN